MDGARYRRFSGSEDRGMIKIEAKFDRKARKMTMQYEMYGDGDDCCYEFEAILNETYKASKKLYLLVMEKHLEKVTSGALDEENE